MDGVSDELDISRIRVRNRWGEGERLRVEILDAASTLLSDLGGEDGLTIRGVARAVGIAPASIYQHFTDRAALVAGLLEYEFGRLQALMLAADEGLEPADVIDRVHAQLHAYCDFAIEHPGHYRLILSGGAQRSGPDEPPTGPLMDVVAVLRAAFGRCASAGYALRVPVDRAAVLVFVGVHGRVALLHGSTSKHQVRDLRPFVAELVALVFA